LLQWLPARATLQTVPTISISPVESDDVQIRKALSAIDGLDIDAGLISVRGKFATYLRLLGLFITTNEQLAGLIQNAIDRGDLDEARRLAHSLKGAAGNLGAVRIQQIAAAIELPLKTHSPGSAQEAIISVEDLAIELPNLIALLKPLVSDDSGTLTISI
jgi:HPt (histidine-containing phosphotransfer) domain-containing protein